MLWAKSLSQIDMQRAHRWMWEEATPVRHRGKEVSHVGITTKSQMILWVWSRAGMSFQRCPWVGHLSQRVVLANYFYCPGLDVGFTWQGHATLGMAASIWSKTNPQETLTSELSITNTHNSFEKDILIREGKSGSHIPLSTTPFCLVLPSPCIHTDN